MEEASAYQFFFLFGIVGTVICERRAPNPTEAAPATSHHIRSKPRGRASRAREPLASRGVGASAHAPWLQVAGDVREVGAPGFLVLYILVFGFGNHSVQEGLDSISGLLGIEESSLLVYDHDQVFKMKLICFSTFSSIVSQRLRAHPHRELGDLPTMHHFCLAAK